MSSSLPSRRTLRARLIAEQLALLALVCVVIGVSTVIALRAFLIDQLDGQLIASSSRAQDRAGPPGGGPGGPNGQPERPGQTQAFGQGPGTIIVELDNGVVRRAGRLATGTAQLEQLPAPVLAILQALPVDRNAYPRDLGSLGNYRLMAVPVDGGRALVTGLPLDSAEDTILTVIFILSGVSLAGLAIAGFAGVVIIRRTLRPLNRVAATARRVAELPLDRGEIALSVRVPDEDTDPRTEVGQVGSALNRMLGHIGNALAVRHASETRVRQFVADASHELRTPLAAIRGYAELAERRRSEVPPEVAHAIGRVESEARRMTTLVEDLLLLARLDSGRPLDPQPVDLSRLVLDTVSDAHIAGPEHRWQMELPEEPVLAYGDEARLHQVLANLLANARTHTPPGTKVVTGLSIKEGWVRLTVTDGGPGIPESLLPEVFERFARGDGSRSRAAGSTGLGLAIVAAVVHAHHGTIELASRPGETRFTVLLPASHS
ncbi:MAG: ATP-binding protein [Kibdelosporangium sp.]